MKKLLIICLSLALLASIGCSNEPQNDENSSTTQEHSPGKVSSADRSVSPHDKVAAPSNLPKRPIIDPVDGSLIENVEAAKDSFYYNGIKLYFSSKKNCEEFKKDPDKYPGRIPKR